METRVATFLNLLQAPFFLADERKYFKNCLDFN